MDTRGQIWKFERRTFRGPRYPELGFKSLRETDGLATNIVNVFWVPPSKEVTAEEMFVEGRVAPRLVDAP